MKRGEPSARSFSMRSAAVACFVLVEWAAACGGGTGTPDAIPLGKRETPPGSRDNPGAGREAPGATGQDSLASSGPGACPPCDKDYTCVLTASRKMDTVSLVMQNGQCVTGDGDIVLACGGTLIVRGTNLGSWSVGSDGTLTACTNVQDGCSVCTPGRRPIAIEGSTPPSQDSRDGGTNTSDAAAMGK